MISRTAISWLNSALSMPADSYSSFPAIRLARTVSREGKIWLVSTNTHVLFGLDITSSGFDLDAQSIDLRGMLNDLDHHRIGTGVVKFDKERSVWLLFESWDAGAPTALYPQDRYVRTEPGSKYPDVEKVVPSGLKGLKSPFAINHKFLAAACVMASANRVVLRNSSPSGPLLITPGTKEAWASPWFAVVMPMAIHDGGIA